MLQSKYNEVGTGVIILKTRDTIHHPFQNPSCNNNNNNNNNNDGDDGNNTIASNGDDHDDCYTPRISSLYYKS